MQIIIDIPDEQIKKSLEESKYIHEDEGEKGFVELALLYTNAKLEFVDIVRKTDFYPCKYKILPKGHGRIVDISKMQYMKTLNGAIHNRLSWVEAIRRIKNSAPTIVEADKESEE